MILRNKFLLFLLILNKGVKEIKEWTKESLRAKPFSTAKGKLWTETPSSIPLEKIYTKLSWLKKRKEEHVIVKEELSDITELLGDQQLKQQHLEEKGAVRIGVKGKYCLLIQQFVFQYPF